MYIIHNTLECTPMPLLAQLLPRQHSTPIALVTTSASTNSAMRCQLLQHHYYKPHPPLELSTGAADHKLPAIVMYIRTIRTTDVGSAVNNNHTFVELLCAHAVLRVIKLYN
jgi:hypothetical protein